jgi:hypothetical protein
MQCRNVIAYQWPNANVAVFSYQHGTEAGSEIVGSRSGGRRHPGIDILINNRGMMQIGNPGETSSLLR